MEEHLDRLKPAHCTRYQEWILTDPDGRCLVKGELTTPEDDKSFIKEELDYIMTDGEFESMAIKERTPEDDKSSTKKELDHIMTDSEFETMEIKKEVEDNILNIKEEVDPLSTDNFTETEKATLQLVPTLQELHKNGQHILSHDPVSLLRPINTAKGSIPLKLLAQNDFKQAYLEINTTKTASDLVAKQSIKESKLRLEKDGMHDEVLVKNSSDSQRLLREYINQPSNPLDTIYKGRQLYRPVKKSLAYNCKLPVATKRVYLQCTKQPVNQAFSRINSGNVQFIQRAEVGHYRAAVNNNKKVLVYYIKPSVIKLTTAGFQSDICDRNNKYKYNGNLNKEEGSSNLKINNDNGHITKTGSMNISQEKVILSDDVQNKVVDDKHLSDSDEDRNVNNEENEQSVVRCIRKNFESLKLKIGQQFNDKLLRHPTSEQSISKVLAQLNASRIEYFRGRKYFYCALCNKRFGGSNKLKMHVESKCGSLKLFNCSTCAKGFTTKSYLKHHINVVHNVLQNPKFKCEECNISFSYRNTFYRHNKVKHQLQINNKSSICEDDRTKHQEEKRIRQTCEYCQKSYFSTKSLKSHISFKHRLDSESFECAHCMKQYPNKYNLRAHIRRIHMTDQIKCTSCNNIFATQENLERHLKDMHKEETKYVCDVCGKCVKNKLLLSNHLRIHTGEKPFMCQTCGKCFKSESNLVQHSVIHSDTRPYGCDLCSKSFRIRNHLRQHMAVHGLNNTSVKYRKQRKER